MVAAALTLFGVVAWAPLEARAAPLNLIVDSETDAPDSAVGDGECATNAGDCTLRAAIQEANDNPGADAIAVPAGTYELAVPPSGDNLAGDGDLDITDSVTITGAGAATTIVDGGEPASGSPAEQTALDRLLEIHADADAVTITGLTLREGWHEEAGGAVYNSSNGAVLLDDVAVLDSAATTAGGGIYHGEPVGFACTPPCIGGTGSLTLVDSTVEGNAAGGEGGGLFVMFGTLRVTNTTVAANTALTGAGIYNAGELSESGLPARAELTGATIADNLAGGGGGGIYGDHEGSLTLTDTTLEGNAAFDNGGGLVVASKARLSVDGGTVTGNKAVGAGGGMFTDVERSVEIDGTTFEENVAGATMTNEIGEVIVGEEGGGALYAGGSGSVEVTGATFTANEGTGGGGGILIGNNGSVTIRESEVRENRTEANGGGILNEGMRVTFDQMTIADNFARFDGGGLESEGSGNFTLRDSTVARNTAENGGGFSNAADGTSRVVGSTFWDNRALLGGSDDSGLGGGIYGLGDADQQYENVTISGNLAQVRGGGLYTDADAGVSVVNATITGNLAPLASGVGGEVTQVNWPIEPSPSVLFRNTLVAGNLHSPSCNFAVGSEGGNLDDADSCHFRGLRDRTHAPFAGLDAIADNGGPTITHALQEGSFALDGGTNPCPPVDQRGVERPQNELCDIGAFESEGPFPPADDEDPETEVVDGPLHAEEFATFVFGGSDNVTPEAELLYECRIVNTDVTEPPEPVDPTEPPDPELAFLGCPNPYIADAIEEGANVLEVRAVDRAGNFDRTPAVHHFIGGNDQTPPETFFTLTPSNPSTGRTAVFGFAGTDDVTPPILIEFECRIDTFDPEAWLECTSPTSFANLSTGSHRVEVRAFDEAGLADPTPATYIWTVGSPADCADANVTLPATADSFVDERNTEENFGTEDGLTVRSAASGEDARTLVRFDVPTELPGTCVLESARLRLYAEGQPGRTLEARPVTGDWVENEVTWLNQPGTSAAAPATASSGNGHREWNVTAHVAAMLAGEAPDHGWMIADAVEEDELGEEQTFSSRHTPLEPDAPPEVPQLVLRFAGPAAPPPPAPDAPVPTLVSCGQILTQSTLVMNDLFDCPLDGLVIGAANIHVDLNGHTIDGLGYMEHQQQTPGPIEPPEEGLPAGVRNLGYSGVIVSNGTVQQFGYGVQLMAGTRQNVVEGLTVDGNATAGVELADADDGRTGNTVRNNTFNENELGVSLKIGSENSVVEDNTFVGNIGAGILLFDASGHRIEGNDISGVVHDPALDSDGGIRLEGATDNVLRGNTLAETGDAGIVVTAGSHRNVVEGNTMSRNGDAGVVVEDSDDNDVVDNIAHLGSDAGIGVSGSRGNEIRGNDVRFNPGGIQLEASDGNIVEDNDATLGSGTGIDVAGLGNQVLFNDASGNTGGGIAVEGEAVDAQGQPDPDAGNVVAFNATHDNLSDGVAVGGVGNTVTANAANDNDGWGISADADNVDGGANTANGNTELDQCTGVVCGPGTPTPTLDPDITAPETTITEAPADPSSGLTSATFRFTGTDDVAPATALLFECRLNAPPDAPTEPPEPPEPPEPGQPPEAPEVPEGENWVPCTSPVIFPFMPTGEHKFEVRAIDPFDNFDITPAVHEWEVVPAAPGPDDVAPNTVIVDAPEDPSFSTSASFTFRGSDNATPGPHLTFQCRLDGGAFAPCTSPQGYSGLGLGAHTFEVRSVDVAGNPDASPAVHTWTIETPPPDVTPPDTTIDSGPDPTTVATTATFRFSSDEAGATFQCALDPPAPPAVPTFTPCTSPHEITDLEVGEHTLLVRAIDAAGLIDPVPATFTWMVSAAPVPATVECGEELTESTLVLNDLADCPGDGLVVAADGITVDLDGHTIDGTNLGVGVRNDGHDAVTVTDGDVTGFSTGVRYANGSAGGIVSQMTVQLSTEVGVLFENADDGVTSNTVRNSTLAGNAHGVGVTSGTRGAVVVDNTVSGSTLDGIILRASDATRVEGNLVTSTSGMGIRLEGAADSTVTGNEIVEASDDAIGLELGSHGNTISENVVEGSNAGIHVLDSDGNTLSGNSANHMGGAGLLLENSRDGVAEGNELRFSSGGIEMQNSTGWLIEDNDASENSGTGIGLTALSLGNVLRGNQANDNDADGIAVDDPAPPGMGNLIDGNTANNNGSDGIAVDDVGHMIRGNVANHNVGWGIYAALGTVAGVNIDGGGNLAIGNEGGPVDPVTLRPEQCFGVRCDGGTPAPVDQVAPETTLGEGPSGTTSFTSATFEFSGSDNASTVELECRIDGGPFAPCTSPHTLTGLGLGEHTFEVRAVDFSGNADATPASRTWTIVAWPPGVAPDTTIDSGPARTTVATSAAFTFSADEEGVTFECSLDGAAFAACTSPAGYGSLTVGPHTFQVRAVDGEGLRDGSPASYPWTVTSAPVATSVSCGQTLTQSTLVTNDLTDCGGNGLVIGADGITVDLDGHTIDGTGLGAGVLVNGFDSVTVTNGAVQEFDVGVQLNGGASAGVVSFMTLTLNHDAGIGLSDADDNAATPPGPTGNEVVSNDVVDNDVGILVDNGTQAGLIRDNSVTLSSTEGVRVLDSSGLRIEANRVGSNGTTGIALLATSGSTVVDNTLTANSGGGIAIGFDGQASNDNVVEGNTVTASSGPGISVLDSARATVTDNTVQQSSDAGIALDGATDSEVTGNDVRFNASGIELIASTGNLVEGNDAGGSSGTGITLESQSFANVIRDNRVNGGAGGIEVSDVAPEGQGNLIEGNFASNNSGDGIFVTGGNTVTGNTADANDGWGIFAEPGAIDGGGNKATGNAEPTQCSGVVCEIGVAPGAPDTEIREKPSDPSSSRNALFTFTGIDDTTPVADLGFECRLDPADPLDPVAGWTECDNPHQLTDLEPGHHVFQVRAVDAGDLVDPSPATFAWDYVALPPDVAPDTFIGLHPPEMTWVFEALFTFSANEPDVTFECSLDDGSFEPCAFAFEHEFEETETGLHSFEVRATDADGNTDQSPARFEWRILGPVTTVTSGPAYEPPTEPGELPSGGETSETTATLEFVANVADATYRCSLDLGPFEECTSPVTFEDLAVGEHSFRVIATGPDGVSEAEAAEYTWEVIPALDTVPPVAQITAGPAHPTGTPTFTFTGTDNVTAANGLVFECSLDDPADAAFAECASPWAYPNPELPEPLTPGPHTFYVRAIDIEDNVSEPVSVDFSFAGDTVAPLAAVASGPADMTAAVEATFTLTVDDPNAVLECALDAAAFEPCESPHDVQGLEPGAHELQVRATDLNGNVGPVASHPWTVVGPPETVIDTAPEVTTTETTATFTFSSDQAGATFRCSLDGEPFTTCESPFVLEDLAGGTYTFEVQARNAFGLFDETPAQHEWTVDVAPPSPPETTIDSGPAAVTQATTATFEFSSDVAGSTFACSLDEAAFEPCTSPLELTGLALGEHTLEIQATDPDGEVDATPAVHEWTIQPPTPPQTTIDGGPPASTLATTATFTFSSNEPGTFECSLDGAAFAPCTSPVELTGLSVASHTFRVRAVDEFGTPDDSPAASTWVVTTCGTTQTVTANADSWLEQSSPTSNKGSDSDLKVKSQGTNQNFRAVVRFPLPASIPAGCVVESATLRMFASSQASGRTLQALQANSAWAENTVNWNNQPSTTGTAATVASGSGWREWNVASHLQAMFDAGTGGNQGWVIRDAAENGPGAEQSFNGRSHGSNRPQLVFRFAPAPPGGPPTTTTTTAPGSTTTTTAATTTTAPGVDCGAPRTLTASRDAWIEQSSPSTNKGDDSALKVTSKSGSSNVRTLVGFTLPTDVPAGCALQSATLRLDAGSAVDGRTLQVLRANAAWTETGVTWSNQPATTGTAATTASGQGWREWNVTAIVQAQAAGTNHGFLVRDSAESSSASPEQSFASRESGGNQPQLVITYSPAG